MAEVVWLQGWPISIQIVAPIELCERMTKCPADLSSDPCECGVHKALEQIKEALERKD